MTRAARTTRLLVVLLALILTAAGCYEESSRLPQQAAATDADNKASEPEQAAASASPTRTASQPPSAPPAQSAASLRGLSLRLGRPSDPPGTGQLPGAGTWRAAEFAKVQELLTDCCRADASGCSLCLQPIAQQGFPAEDLWPLIGQFLGPVRQHAELGLLSLGAPLITHPDGDVRDRIYRMAVGGGVSRRGQPDGEDRRASTIPLVPQLGKPVWLVVEQLSPCPDLHGEVKGPDRTGRVDLVLSDRCSEAQWQAAAERFPPRATRGVWALAVAAMPSGGLTLWMGGAEEPLLRARPGREASSQQSLSP